MADRRIEELEQLARDEGITLPYPSEVIVGLEEKGRYVDLQTGLIGDSSERVDLTALGEAVVIVDQGFEDL